MIDSLNANNADSSNSDVSASVATTGLQQVKKLVSGGCDKAVKIWTFKNDDWEMEEKLEAHSDWVRDVAWAPSIGLPRSLIASCGQDKWVYLWEKDAETGK